MKYLLILSLLFSIVLAPQGQGYTSQPDEASGVDSVIGTANPNANYGTLYTCNTGEEAGSTDTGRCLVRFGLPQNVTVISAALYMTQWGESSTNDATINIHLITQDWTEMGATWNNQPSVGDVIGSRSFSASEANGEKMFPLNVDAVQVLVNGSPNYGFELRTSTEVDNLYRFYSSAASIGSQRPKLVIEYSTGTPMPSLTGESTPTLTSTPALTLTLTPTLTPAPTLTPTIAVTYTPIVPVSSFMIPLSKQGNLHIFAGGGQSNWSGRGNGSACASASENIYNFGNDYRWRILCEPSDDSAGQVDTVSIDSAGYGPSLSFARKIKELHPDWSIGIINCAKGATSISQWQRSLADDTLYGSCRKRIAAAQMQGQLEAFLFWQGESDAQNYQDASAYGLRFSEFIYAVQNDYRVPVIFAQLGNHGDDAVYPYYNLIRTHQQNIAIPCTRMVTTFDIPMNGLHHFSSGYDIVGERFANVFDTLAQCWYFSN